MNSTTQTREIVQLGMDARYLDARRAVAERKMRLPPHPMLDAYVQRNRVCGFWADELLARPEKGRVFQSGKDVKDALTGMILPASYVPKEAVGREGVGLFVVPEDVREERGKVIVHAQSVIVLDGLTQESDKWVPGKPHEITRIPLVVSAEEFERLPEEEKRWLYRIAGEGVRPLARGDVNDWYRGVRRYVYADCGFDYVFGVAGVAASDAHAESGMAPIVRGAEQSGAGAPKKAPPKLQVEAAPEDKGILIKGVPAEQFGQMLADAKAELAKLALTVRDESVQALSRLSKSASE
ncbi:MAG: hypothetical protein AB1657_00405 [Candidatus Micrarchaeota archaeon]